MWIRIKWQDGHIDWTEPEALIIYEDSIVFYERGRPEFWRALLQNIKDIKVIHDAAVSEDMLQRDLTDALQKCKGKTPRVRTG